MPTSRLHNSENPLLVAGLPTNLRLPEGSCLAYVDSDLHDICGRIAEITPQLRVVVAQDPEGVTAFVITELVTRATGPAEELVLRVGPGCEIDALDGRVIDRINFIRHFTPAERAAEIDKQIARDEVAREAAQAELLWEKLGAPMYRQMSPLGFTHDTRVEQIPTLTKARQRARSGRR